MPKITAMMIDVRLLVAIPPNLTRRDGERIVRYAIQRQQNLLPNLAPIRSISLKLS